MAKRIQVRVNGRPLEAEVPDHWLLLDVLREVWGLTGAKEGCGEGACGACTVHLNGRPVRSCLTLAAWADGGEVTTVEGLGEPGRLHPLQEAFVRSGGFQCGYCTPGMVMAAKALLDDGIPADEAAVREALSGNICRCTGYNKIIDAVLEAIREARA